VDCSLYNSSGTELPFSWYNNQSTISDYAYVAVHEGLSSSIKFTYRSYLSVPTGVTAKQDGSSVFVSWNNVPAATSYIVYRSNSYNGTYTAIRTGISGTSTTDTPPLNGTYYYKVEANRSANPSTKSDLSGYVSVNDCASVLRLRSAPGY